ncbi:hypothetical protein BH11PLA1_BH11PLA1_06450 [soil metagenome]
MQSPLRRRAFTLIEMTIVVALMGLAGALVIPSMGSVGALRVQAALRTLVSDITFAQSDAIAFQQKRAIVFDTVNNTYSLLAVQGATLDATTQMMYDPSKRDGKYTVRFSDKGYAGATLSAVTMNGSTATALVFDELGTPVVSAASDQPTTGGSITLSAPDSRWSIVVDAFTGRVSVRKLELN